MTYQCTCHNKIRLTLDEAFELAEVKANLDWMPVVPAPPDPMLVMAEAFKASLDREPVQPVVNVTTPDVSIYPTFNIPEQPIIPAPVVNVTVPPTKATTKRVIRNDDGAITGIEETE